MTVDRDTLLMYLAEYFLEEYPTDNPVISEKNMSFSKIKIQQKWAATHRSYEELGLDVDLKESKEALQTLQQMPNLEYPKLLDDFRKAFDFSLDEIQKNEIDNNENEAKLLEELTEDASDNSGQVPKKEKKKGYGFFSFGKR